MMDTSSREITGKKILITGAAKRIGRSLALACAIAGADVVIHYNKSASEAQKLKEEIEKTGRSATLIQTELSDLRAVEALIPEVSRDGPLYGLINNASVFSSMSWDNTSLEDWQFHLDVNLTAPFILSKIFASSLPPGSQARIINMLDWRALRPGTDHFPYTISKAALAALTRSLAIAFAPHITVNGIALGAILPPNDPSSETSFDHTEVLASVPQQRWGDLDAVTQTVLFLMSGPSYITGEIIHIDGGRHLI